MAKAFPSKSTLRNKDFVKCVMPKAGFLLTMGSLTNEDDFHTAVPSVLVRTLLDKQRTASKSHCIKQSWCFSLTLDGTL